MALASKTGEQVSRQAKAAMTYVIYG
jgi:hypothetical protein